MLKIKISRVGFTLIFLQFAFGCSNKTKIEIDQLHSTNKEAFKLFNGYNFEGWNVDRKYFYIEDSTIVGGTLQQPIEDLVWLTTQKEYSNFELDVDVKILGGDVEERYPNGGIWFRCRYDEEGMLIGYEADMMINYEVEDSIWWGSLHDPFRRDFDDFNIVGNQDTLRRVYKHEDWNHFKIYCNGPQIKVWLNDFLTSDFTEADKSIEANGIIGLQLHDGPPSKVWYKNVILKEI
jgi:hypothetical protein